MPSRAQPRAGVGFWPFDPGRFGPYIAAHEQVISPRNFFQVAPPPRGLATSRPRARSRLAFHRAAGSAALSLINFRGFGLGAPPIAQGPRIPRNVGRKRSREDENRHTRRIRLYRRRTGAPI